MTLTVGDKMLLYNILAWLTLFISCICPGEEIGLPIFDPITGQMGVINTSGEVLVLPTWERIGPQSDGLLPFMKGTTWGYMNTRGTVIIPSIYTDAAPFHEGFDRVLQEDKWGFINTKGTVVIKPMYEAAWDKGGARDV